tara:strand:- start:7 stop:453 length:447 start_codon:yes stop_codon:yes gene_type:complete
MIGNMLRDREVQYVAAKDELTNTWRILDTWHDDLKSLQPEDEIDDETEAVKILTEGEFIAIIREASRTGVLANANFGTGEAEYEATILEKDQEIQRLNERILLLEEDKSQVIRDVTHSEDYELKEKAMQSILKLVSMQDMTNLGRNNK